MAGEEEWRGVLEAARLSDLAAGLRRYFAAVVAAFSFFFYGAVATSYWLAVAAIGLLTGAEDEPVFWVTATLVMVPVFVLAGILSGTVSPRVGSKTWKRKGRLAGLIFILVFASAYVIAGALPPAVYSVVWYPALAAALLTIHFFVEREAYRRGEVTARPFLVSGFLVLATTPLVLCVAVQHLQAGWMLALSLMLASYSTAAFAALRGATRVLEARGGREGGEVRGPPEVG